MVGAKVRSGQQHSPAWRLCVGKQGLDCAGKSSSMRAIARMRIRRSPQSALPPLPTTMKNKVNQLLRDLSTPFCILIYMALLIHGHSHMDANSSRSSCTTTTSPKEQQLTVMQTMVEMKQRLIGGPEALSPLDLALLGALVLLGLELLNILVKRFCRRLVDRNKCIPVRGKHLDVLSSVGTVYRYVAFLNRVFYVPVRKLIFILCFCL